ncbi:MAG: relaxase/mobilization nuclease domain-containing protein [Ruminococcus sp.]|jgi:nitrate/TMAO reductase-like tetraheme cytochrome c subunit
MCNPSSRIAEQLLNQIDLETAKAFEGFEVVVATHIDRDHWHNHFVVNSVNSETGLKIQINEKGLEELRNRSDQICQQFVLEVLTPYEKPKQRSMNQREYRTAIHCDSKKLRLMNAIDMAVVHSQSKEKFIENMKRLGYGVKWIDRYKYITYTTPDGQRKKENQPNHKNIA